MSLPSASHFQAKEDEYHRISSEETNGVCSYQNTKPLRLFPPAISSGRRKRRRPKKLATLRRYRFTDDNDDELPPTQYYDGLSDEDCSNSKSSDISEQYGMEKYTSQNSPGSTKYNQVEEYPVMIIGEHECIDSLTESQVSAFVLMSRLRST